MKIHDDHLYHGAALIQIAEHPQFTAINSFSLQGEPNRSAYKINDHVGVYLKYCASPTKNYDEYTFTFNTSHLDILNEMRTQVRRVILTLVCVKDRQICCITHDELISMVEKRRAHKEDENQYIVKVTAPEGKSMRTYFDYPGKRKTILGKAIVVARNRFPDLLFE
jgi:hypothetical protein